MGSPEDVAYRPVRQNPWWIPPFMGGIPAGLGPEDLRSLGSLLTATSQSASQLVMLRALATELFPTALRSSAGGALALLETLGAVAGLFLYSRAMDRFGDQRLVVPILSLATLLAAAAVFVVPETARRELEQISDEAAARETSASSWGSSGATARLRRRDA